MTSQKKGSKYVEDTYHYFGDLLAKKDVSNLTVKDILGFEPREGANVFVPHVSCVPIKTLLPLYDRLTVGIPKIRDVSQIQTKVGLA